MFGGGAANSCGIALGLLLKVDYLPVVVAFSDVALTRIVHGREHDLRVRPLGAELLHQWGDSAADEVVAG
jgi:hypothetical protein